MPVVWEGDCGVRGDVVEMVWGCGWVCVVCECGCEFHMELDVLLFCCLFLCI